MAENIEREIGKAVHRSINDREYRVIIPKSDNSGKKIDVDLIREIALEVSDRFGGVTVFPSVAGCFEADGELMCEENLIISTVRDSESGVPFEHDRDWIEELAEDVGEEFGQISILTSEDVVGVDFVEGKYRESLDSSKTDDDVFSRLI